MSGRGVRQGYSRRLAAPFWIFPLVFLFVGPPVGALALVLTGFFEESGRADPPTLLEFVANLPALMAYGYIFGFIPATITGLAAGLMAKVTRSFVIWLLMTMIFGAWISSLISGTGATILAISGGCAALASGLAVLMISRER